MTIRITGHRPRADAGRRAGVLLVAMFFAGALVLTPGAARSETEADLGFLAGAAWAVPVGGAIGDAYGGAPLGRIGLVLRGSSRFQGTLSTGFLQAEAHPSSPVFLERVESKLRLVPLSLAGRYFLLDRVRSPYVSLGLELWFLSETFEYRLAAEDRKADGSRTSLAGVLGFGHELSGLSFPLRICGQIELSSLEKRWLTADGTVFEGTESALSTFFSLGVEVER